MRRVLVIPAAGLGERLGGAAPKILVQVGGRPMLDHLIELYAPYVDRFLVIVRPDPLDRVRAYCDTLGAPIECLDQPSPSGMLDAILVATTRVAELAPSNVWITWCDQVAIHPATVRELARLTNPGVAGLVMPTVTRAQPYVHFVRDERSRIIAVRHRREGDPMPEVGEADVGLFSLSLAVFSKLLPRYAESASSGGMTGERNFLPFIPWLAQQAPVHTFKAQDPNESIGVNTPEDRYRIERYLRDRGGSS